jgi:hypothetical protein
MIISFVIMGNWSRSQIPMITEAGAQYRAR